MEKEKIGIETNIYELQDDVRGKSCKVMVHDKKEGICIVSVEIESMTIFEDYDTTKNKTKILIGDEKNSFLGLNFLEMNILKKDEKNSFFDKLNKLENKKEENELSVRYTLENSQFEVSIF